MAEKMTLEKLALITMHGFEEVRGGLDNKINGLDSKINDLRKEVRAEFKLVHQEIRVLRDTYDRRLTRLEEKVL